MAILVTGAAGYIGSHAVQRLLKDGQTVVGLDNMQRGNRGAVRALEELGGKQFSFEEGDTTDRSHLERLMMHHHVDAVLHFAALSLVGESVIRPLEYHRNNSLVPLLEAARDARVKRLVFSSTCAVYGQPPSMPVTEDAPFAPVSPYGASKLHGERVLEDFLEARMRQKSPFAFAALRYFNVAGCDRTGVLGEDHDPHSHIIPIVLEVALGKRDSITIFGDDYDTPDGTCIRDYIHVEDLVDAHVRVLGALEDGQARRYNLGIGKGYSVKDIVESCRRVTGHAIPAEIGPRRPGDPPALYADPAKVQQELGWKAEITDLDAIIESAWKWMKANPEGYGS
ncbi:MAG: UDP-glucose 4-epimerase GalE [Phycisphaerales bacterium]|jgi:UDP-glucose 4-epimerase